MDPTETTTEQFDSGQERDIDSTETKIQCAAPGQERDMGYFLKPLDINDMPTEILLKIFSYLPIQMKFVCEGVCHYWQQNVFSSIDSISFKLKASDVCIHSRHEVRRNCLHRKMTLDCEIMKCILSKCGKYLFSFQGWVNYESMLIIAKYCRRLRCISMVFRDMKSFELLCEKFGKQLTCVTVFVNEPTMTKTLINSCPNLVSFAVIPDDAPYDLHPSYYSMANTYNDEYVDWQQLLCTVSSLRHLEILTPVTPGQLRAVAHLPKLDVLSLNLGEQFIESKFSLSAMTSWTGLRSLTLVLSDCYDLDLELLPPHLEYLELIFYRYAQKYRIRLPVFSSTLKTFKINRLSSLPVSTIIEFLKCLVLFCPNLESLSMIGSFDMSGMDMLLTLLLSMPSLKQLSLCDDWCISDTFAAKLIIDLPNLTSLGSDIGWYKQCLVPVGETFWKALQEKASSRPNEIFHITGRPNETLYLSLPFPSNIHLNLECDTLEISLSNGFGQSLQWQMISRWFHCRLLQLELQDINCNLISLPDKLRNIRIICSNENRGTEQEALTFTSRLPKLVLLEVHQRNMSNIQLKATMACISNFCPNLKELCIRRDNEELEPIDVYIEDMLECHSLHSLCVTKNFVISDEFAARLVDKLENLTKFGSEYHSFGINCGRQFLTAVVSKATRGTKMTVVGGPTCREVMQKLKVLKLPDRIHFLPREPMTHCNCDGDLVNDPNNDNDDLSDGDDDIISNYGSDDIDDDDDINDDSDDIDTNVVSDNDYYLTDDDGPQELVDGAFPNSTKLAEKPYMCCIL